MNSNGLYFAAEPFILDRVKRLSNPSKPINFLKLELESMYPFDVETGKVVIPKNHVGYAINKLMKKFPYNNYIEIKNIVNEYVI